MKYFIPFTLFSLAFPIALNAATFSIVGTSEIKLSDQFGVDLTSGSIIQVGYFTTDAATNPSSYDATVWDSFTPIVGVGSLNPSKTVSIGNLGAGFPANFDFNAGFDTESDTLSDATGNRLGIRIFDNADSSATAAELLLSDYNTVSSSIGRWVLPGESGGNILNPVLYIADDPDSTDTLSWQFGSGTEFMTVAVPEPSTGITALLGAALLLGSRRRK